MSTRLHATAVLIGERAVLIQGPSGSGKSALALALLTRPLLILGGIGPVPVRLIADDQTLVEVAGGRLIARPHPELVGLIEARGYGLVKMPHERSAVVGLVVMRGNADRLPTVNDSHTLIDGVRLPCLALPPDVSAPVDRVLFALSRRPVPCD